MSSSAGTTVHPTDATGDAVVEPEVDPCAEVEDDVRDPGATGEVEVRRRGEVTGAVGVAGCLVALAWFARATASGSAADWTLCLLVAAVGVVNLLALVDARTPVLVADGQGVRVRRGRTWHGLTWQQVERAEVHPRRGLRDGTLRVTAADQGPLRVPLTLTTRVAGAVDLTTGLADLAGDRAAVVEVEPDETVAPDASPVDGAGDADPADPADAPARDRDVLVPGPPPLVASSTPLPLRDPTGGARSDVVLGATALRLDPHDSDDSDGSDGATDGADRRGPRLPEARELRRDGSVDLVEETSLWGDRVRPIARPGEAVLPLVIEDHAPRPVVDPVIGPELTAARTRLGLSVDQLAERTRVRPHVIESIEVDDFAPCGGDFYARGHLRTLARVLGVDVAPLLATYDDRYADAPIDARRVFEAELATASGGAIRGTRGGPNWSVLVAAVMTVILVWSVAQLVVDRPTEVTAPSVRLNSSGGVDNGVQAGTGAAVPVELTAAGGGAQVIVRSGSQVVFDDQLAFMQTVQLDVAPPVRVSSTDGGLVVSVDGEDQGPLGETGQDAQDVFVP